MRCEGGSLHEKSSFPENSSKRIGARRYLRMGLGLARVREGQPLGVAPTERPKQRRQIAAAGKYSVSFSLFLGGESTGGGRGDIHDGNPFCWMECGQANGGKCRR